MTPIKIEVTQNCSVESGGDALVDATEPYHTQDITLERLEDLILELCDGKLAHDRVLEEGGHGAYLRKALDYQTVEVTIATGPKRRLVEPSKLQISFGSPWGDNMMTGTVGLLEALRRRKGLEPINYI